MADAASTGTESPRCLADKRMATLKQERTNIEPLWRELRDAFLPQRGRFTTDEDLQHKRVTLLNETPLLSCGIAASGLHAGLTSPARPWLRSGIPDSDGLSEFGPVKEWLAIVDQRMLACFARGNLYQALPFMYGEYAGFGTMAGLTFEDDETLVRFEPLTVGQYYLARSDRGVYDTMGREFDMTIRQAVRRFGEMVLSPQSREKWRNASHREQRITITHLIEPAEGGGFDSCYYETKHKDGPREGLLKRSRFTENPILAASWESIGVEPYATNCPGMTARGAAKALQIDERNKARAIERHHNPPMQGPSLLKASGVSLLPGSMNWVDQAQASGNNGGIRPVHDFTPNIQGLLDNIAKREKRIERAFFVDLFLMLTMDERNQRATAEEIRAKYDEKVLALGPTLEQANQMLRTLYSRVFGIMMRRSLPIWEGRIEGEPILPPPPPELRESGANIQPEFISALQQAQRAQSLQGIERFASFAGSFAQFTKKLPDKLDVDQALDEYATALGVPPKMVRDDEEVAAIRQADAKAAQAQQMATMAPALNQAASAVKSLGEAKPEDGSVLAALSGAGAK